MKILWVKSDFLHPTNRGGQIRTLEMLRRLHSRHEVHYVAFDNSRQPEGLRRANEYCSYAYPVAHEVPPHASLAFVKQSAQNLFSSMPLALSRYVSVAMRKQIDDLIRRHQFDSIVCDFIFPAPNFSTLNDCVLFQHNVETVIWRRHAEHAGDPLRRWFFRLQASRMFNWEQRICAEAARVIAVSPGDAEMFEQLFGVKKVPYVATGVDTDYFRRPERSEHVADLVFIGSMDWMPSIDAMKFFAGDVLPLIRKRRPGCTLAIVGRSPSAATLALAELDRGIRVTGTVPDVRPYLWGSTVSIVPIRIGGGTRLKIYEAMAAGVPVVSTTVGAEGLDVSKGDNIRLADTPESFAAACLDLMDNAAERERQAATALELVQTKYSWDQITLQFEGMLKGTRPAVVA
jgi:glycosyltransferase involved in cell wall biosynthesis